MPEIGTSGLMSGEGKRDAIDTIDGRYRALPRLYRGRADLKCRTELWVGARGLSSAFLPCLRSDLMTRWRDGVG